MAAGSDVPAVTSTGQTTRPRPGGTESEAAKAVIGRSRFSVRVFAMSASHAAVISASGNPNCNACIFAMAAFCNIQRLMRFRVWLLIHETSRDGRTSAKIDDDQSPARQGLHLTLPHPTGHPSSMH